jgi:hypothetical protein
MASFAQQVTALQDIYAAAVAHGGTLPAADVRGDLPEGVTQPNYETALAATAARQGRSKCAWGRTLLAAAEWEAKVDVISYDVIRWEVYPHAYLHPAEEQLQQQ